MTATQLTRRLDRLELARQPATAGPGYVCFATEAELRAYLAQPHSGPRVTAYVGATPDDWDGDE